MTEEQEEARIELIELVVSDYLSQLDDPGQVEARDLAENIAHQLEKANERG